MQSIFVESDDDIRPSSSRKKIYMEALYVFI